MYQVTVMDISDGRQIIATRIYKEFQNAFSDVINGNSDIHATLEDFGKGVIAGKPQLINSGGTKPNGYDDDFHFRYENGIVIVIGEVVVVDQK